MDKYQAFANLLKNEETRNTIITDSIEETQQNLKAHGLDFSIEELEEIAKQTIAQAESDELDENSLENVAGGVAGLCAAFLVCEILVIGCGHVKKWLKRKK